MNNQLLTACRTGNRKVIEIWFASELVESNLYLKCLDEAIRQNQLSVLRLLLKKNNLTLGSSLVLLRLARHQKLTLVEKILSELSESEQISLLRYALLLSAQGLITYLRSKEIGPRSLLIRKRESF